MAEDECQGTLAITEQPGKFSFSPPTRRLCYKSGKSTTASLDMQALMKAGIDYKTTDRQHTRLVLYGSMDPEEDQDPFGPQQAQEMSTFWKKVAAKQQKAAIRKMRPRWGRRR